MIKIADTSVAIEQSALPNINAIENVSTSQSEHFTTFAVCLDTRYAMQRVRYQGRCNVILQEMHIYERKSICKFNFFKICHFCGIYQALCNITISKHSFKNSNNKLMEDLISAASMSLL